MWKHLLISFKVHIRSLSFFHGHTQNQRWMETRFFSDMDMEKIMTSEKGKNLYIFNLTSPKMFALKALLFDNKSVSKFPNQKLPDDNWDCSSKSLCSLLVPK